MYFVDVSREDSSKQGSPEPSLYENINTKKLYMLVQMYAIYSEIKYMGESLIFENPEL